MSPPSPKFVLFAHNATYDKLHQVATLGLTAAAMGKDVIVILLFWTIKKLAEGKLDQIDFPPEYSGSAEIVGRLLKEKHVPTISQMFEEAKLVGKFRIIACSAGLACDSLPDGRRRNEAVYLIARSEPIAPVLPRPDHSNAIAESGQFASATEGRHRLADVLPIGHQQVVEDNPIPLGQLMA
jgi:peroxiredoxin family protein